MEVCQFDGFSPENKQHHSPGWLSISITGANKLICLIWRHG